MEGLYDLQSTLAVYKPVGSIHFDGYRRLGCVIKHELSLKITVVALLTFNVSIQLKVLDLPNEPSGILSDYWRDDLFSGGIHWKWSRFPKVCP